MEEDKFKDLLDDEELTSLRLAALATNRKKEQNAKNATDCVAALPINSIVTSTSESSNQIPFVQSERNTFNNNYWRKQNQSSRRRGGIFPKNNRSNLILISPVSLDEEKNLEKKTPALVLPQHKWCNSGNEDSLSPKTLRRTGPTRFNRHGSDSESSESDYENENDSGSNETVLQDEPAEHFSPDIDTVSDGVEKKRRLSFQNLESEIQPDAFDKTETTSIYNLLKNPSYDCPDNNPDTFVSVQSDGRHVWNHSVENEYSYKQFNSGNAYISEPLDNTEKFVEKQINSLVVSNGKTCAEMNNFMTQSSDASTWQHTDIKTVNSYYSTEAPSILETSRNHGINDRNQNNYSQKQQMGNETQNSGNTVWQHSEGLKSNKSFSQNPTTYDLDSRNYKDDNVKAQLLSEGDLRFELTKRMHEMKSKSPDFEKPSEKDENERYNKNNPWDRINQDNWDKSEHHPNRNRYHRSSSRDRSKQESCSARDRSRYGYSSGPERSRRDRSSSPGRRHERSTSRSRSWRSSSQDKRRNERSSSLGRIGSDEQGFNEERDRLFISHSKTHECQNKSRYEWSSSHCKRRRKHSSSSDSRHERSASQDSRLDYDSNRSRSKRQYSGSRDRKRYKRNFSQERKRYEHSPSRHSPSQERCKHGHTPSRDRSRSSESPGHSSNSSQGKNHNHSKRGIRSTYNKYNPKQHKSRHDITLNQDKDRQECVSGQELLKESNNTTLDINKLPSTEKLESVRENTKFKIDTKEKKSSEDENREESKVSLEKHSRKNASSYKKPYSRSRSSSSTSCSSSSSSSTHRSRPKIRSVSSVVKSVPIKSLDIQNKEMLNDSKSVGKIISLNPQSDVSSASSKKNIDIGDYNKSSFKCGRVDIDFKASDNSKRVPVHMRLGVLPRKRVIQMPKDVEAAFVNSSSSSDGDNFNTKCKRQNNRIVTDVYSKSGFDFEKRHSSNEKSSKGSPDLSQEKSKHLKIER